MVYLFRRERGNCRICYYAVNPTDFHVSGAFPQIFLIKILFNLFFLIFSTSATSTGSTKKGFNKGSVCCSYGASTTKYKILIYLFGGKFSIFFISQGLRLPDDPRGCEHCRGDEGQQHLRGEHRSHHHNLGCSHHAQQVNLL